MHKQRVNNTSKQKSIRQKVIVQKWKGSYNGKEMQNINQAYAPMDRKRAMMNAYIDVMSNGHLKLAKSPTNSVSMTQLYCDKQLTCAVPIYMFLEPIATLGTMYYMYMF